MIFSDDSRAKIPCILHLIRLRYRYHSLKNAIWDEETNISPELFRTAIAQCLTTVSCSRIQLLEIFE